MIDVPLIEPRPTEYQSENWLLDETKYWKKVRRVTASDLDSLFDRSGDLWVDGFSTNLGENDRIPIEIARTLRSSLRLIRVDGLKINVFDAGYEKPKRRVQAAFRHHGKGYALWVTDPIIERQYLSKSDGTYHVGSSYLSISIGEEFQGACYKLVAAIIPA